MNQEPHTRIFGQQEGRISAVQINGDPTFMSIFPIASIFPPT